MEIFKKKIAEIRKKIEKKNFVFAEKRYLDSMILPSKIIGRETGMDVEKNTAKGVS